MYDESTARQASEKVYVRFGPHESDEMPIEWAERILTAWKEKQPAAFGKYLQQAVTGGR